MMPQASDVMPVDKPKYVSCHNNVSSVALGCVAAYSE